MRILLVFSMFLLSHTSYSDTIRLGADEWCPYNCEEGSKTPGYIIEALSEIFTPKEHKISYKVITWNKAVEQAKKGKKLDGAIGATKVEGKGFIFPKLEQGLVVSGFFIRKDDKWRFKDLASLEGKRIGIIRDYEYGEVLDNFFTKWKKNKKLIQVVGGDDAITKSIKKLQKGRLDTYLEDANVFNYSAKTLGIKHLFINGGYETFSTKEENYIYVVFSPNNPKSKEYAEILSNGWQKLRKSGKLGKILSKYGVDDWVNQPVSH